MPFPDPDEATRERIRELGEQLDAHRKRQQALHAGLTLTGMYNVLEKLRAIDHRAAGVPPADQAPTPDSSTPELPDSERTTSASNESEIPAGRRKHVEGLTPKEKQIHEQGLVSVLKQIHDNLDAAVFHAYDWDDLTVGRRSRGASTSDPTGQNTARASSFQDSDRGSAGASPYRDVDEIILERLVALNHERAEEEKRSHIRWLRPEFQNPGGTSSVSPTLDFGEDETEGEKTGTRGTRSSDAEKLSWPKTLSEQVEAVRKAVEAAGSPITAEELAAQFKRANKTRLAEILETLVTLGKVRETKEGKFQP
ncbi:hypothetical protein GC207_05470 [bacterium]|nr:hypothetical protein [bacterium]